MTVPPLSLVASALYLLVAIGAAFAAARSRRSARPPWHVRGWAVLAVFFLVLVAIRTGGIEDLIRDSLREALRANAMYGHRREFQRPLVGGLLVMSFLATFWLIRNLARWVRERASFALILALGGALGMMVLIMLRLISLHAVDALLYGQPKLNWFGDIGLSCLVGGAALWYARLVRQAA